MRTIHDVRALDRLMYTGISISNVPPQSSTYAYMAWLSKSDVFQFTHAEALNPS